MQNKEEKYYIRSNGEKVALSTIDTTHLKNAMSKKMEDLFYTNSKDEFAEKLKEVNELKDEYYKRINKHYEELKD